jgi:hypothetical protein
LHAYLVIALQNIWSHCPGLETAGCQWPKADHILEMAGKNKFEMPK